MCSSSLQDKQPTAEPVKKTKKTAEKKVFVNKTPAGEKKG